MFSRRDEDDHLYDFNAGPTNLAAPGTAFGGPGKAPGTAFRGGAPLQVRKSSVLLLLQPFPPSINLL